GPEATGVASPVSAARCSTGRLAGRISSLGPGSLGSPTAVDSGTSTSPASTGGFGGAAGVPTSEPTAGAGTGSRPASWPVPGTGSGSNVSGGSLSSGTGAAGADGAGTPPGTAYWGIRSATASTMSEAESAPVAGSATGCGADSPGNTGGVAARAAATAGKAVRAVSSPVCGSSGTSARSSKPGRASSEPTSESSKASINSAKPPGMGSLPSVGSGEGTGEMNWTMGKAMAMPLSSSGPENSEQPDQVVEGVVGDPCGQIRRFASPAFREAFDRLLLRRGLAPAEPVQGGL